MEQRPSLQALKDPSSSTSSSPQQKNDELALASQKPMTTESKLPPSIVKSESMLVPLPKKTIAEPK